MSSDEREPPTPLANCVRQHVGDQRKLESKGFLNAPRGQMGKTGLNNTADLSRTLYHNVIYNSTHTSQEKLNESSGEFQDKSVLLNENHQLPARDTFVAFGGNGAAVFQH